MSVETCHRCDLPMEDDGEWFVCPCCRCRTKGRERSQAQYEARMAELGMTEDEYHEYCVSLINPEPLDEQELAGLRAMVGKFAENWTPACPHDTENPWKNAS